ncbi:TPA: FRG domain-containing protein [Aeromonas hydrophila]|uniref:FRG domain-containing protein n=1 Tax=Aeromonas hydrophila TaxID=644 RepID=UPI0009BA036C|nr:FRG domain-containing protein [Aeromonas hydrophila]HAU4885307.1 FRG domain-containing protein [Aeromonas hydrophila]
MAIVERQVSSISELVSNVLDIYESLPDKSALWFRGHQCGDYQLLPGLLRDGKDAASIFERERRLLTRFRQRSMAYWPDGYPQNDWEHLFAMQHFGIPTRLLDWSENIFVAAHFALLNDHEHDGCHPIIWCVEPVLWNRKTPVLSDYGDAIQILTTTDDELEAYRPDTTKRRSKSPLAMYGAHNSGRIVAQRGTFMVWGDGTKRLEDIAGEIQDDILWKIELTGERQVHINSLMQLGFSETMIFPELQYLGKELSRTEGWR